MPTTEPFSPKNDARKEPSRFLTQLADAARRHGHTDTTAADIAQWCKRFIVFHGMLHPQEMGRAEVGTYLQYVAKTEKDPLRAIDAAHRALEFLNATFL